MAPSWSLLPSEILDLILQRLDLPDCFSFHKVCSSWRSVFLNRRRLTRPPPCLILRPSRYRPNTILLHSLHGGRLLKLHSSMLNLNPGEQIVGSSMGWLAIVCYKTVSITSNTAVSYPPSLHLLNPISNQRIPLPSLNTGTIYRVTLSASPTSRDCVLVLSACVNDKSVSCAWCRLGDRQWTSFKVSNESFFDVQDMVFHKGELYILGDKGKYSVLTFDPQLRMAGSGSVSDLSESSGVYVQRMVHFGEELLFVGWRWGQSMVLDLLKQGEEKGKWEKVESLGNRALLSGSRCGEYLESFCPDELMGSGFEPNCIYFGRELLKFSVADGSSQRIHIPHSQNTYFEVEWIVPQAWNPDSFADGNFPPVPSFWLPPPEDTLKINFDAGFWQDFASYGIVIRNHLGHVVRCKYGKCSATDSIYAKGSTLLLGMELASGLNFSRFMFECDDEKFVTFLNFDGLLPPRNARGIIKSCKEFAAKFDKCYFSYIRWEGNKAAHGLTILGQIDPSPKIDMGVTCLEPPDIISDVISAELAYI